MRALPIPAAWQRWFRFDAGQAAMCQTVSAPDFCG